MSVARVLLAAALGYCCWGDSYMLLGMSVVIVYLWVQASSRLQAGWIVAAYYLMVARGMPKGTSVFFGTEASPVIGVAFWLATSAMLAMPWALLWSRQGRGYWWRLPCVLLVIALPPLALFGWGHPLTAAGALFPSASWLGLLATLALMLAYCYAFASKHRTRNTFIVHVLLALAFVYGSSRPVPTMPASEIRGIDTNLSGVGLGQYDFLQSYKNNRSLIEAAGQQTASAILFPESVAGLWLDATADLWAESQPLPELLFLGAAEPHRSGHYSNVLVAVTPLAQRIVYRQRVPVPIGMWHPWREESAVAHWFGPAGFEIGGKRYGVLLCYEQILLWPVLQTFAARPAVVLAPTNAW